MHLRRVWRTVLNRVEKSINMLEPDLIESKLFPVSHNTSIQHDVLSAVAHSILGREDADASIYVQKNGTNLYFSRPVLICNILHV